MAEQKALQLQKDVEAGHFDEFLARYKPERQKNMEQEDKPVCDRFVSRFLHYKAKGVTSKTTFQCPLNENSEARSRPFAYSLTRSRWR
ncbi:MAG: hypothetical protein NW224_09885 [Leptolyngbyaceae cyanobacterium bins.302]|nr:hypothetical protein [Leptolyngbyaceae cyanobacterium bins.302]